MRPQQFILDRQAQVAELCRRAHARRLDAFGSATRPDFNPASSDLDFLVEFEDLSPREYAASFFALKDGLEALFNRPIDLVSEAALRNPYFRRRVQAERVPLYGA